MMTAPTDKFNYVIWQEKWLAENPLPEGAKKESKKARWRRANNAWLEMRRRVRAEERAAAKMRLSSMSLLRVTHK
jgi:hypothetical protein